MAKKKIGISFAGGGLKAFSQIGVLKYLEEQKLFGVGFSGTSMGSLVAAFSACGLKANEIEECMLEIETFVIKEKLLKITNTQFFPLLKSDASGLISPKKFVDILTKQLDKCSSKTFYDLKYPLIVNAVDLNSGKTVLFTNIKNQIKDNKNYIIIDDATLVEALQASCSFPMVFETMIYNDLQLVDGGVSMNAPVVPLKQAGFDPVFSITMGIKSDYQTTKKIIDITSRVVEIIINEADAKSIAFADLNINVFDKNIGMFSFGKGKEAIDLGYRVAKEHHQEIMDFKERGRASWLELFK